MAEDNEGRLVTINENKGGRVREKNEGTRCVQIYLVFLACVSTLQSLLQLRMLKVKYCRAGESDLLFFNLSTGSLVKRVELADVIADKEKSKCRCFKVVKPCYQQESRFLTRGLNGSLVITDLGMDRYLFFIQLYYSTRKKSR